MLADLLGVPQGTVSKMESGLKPVSDDVLSALSRILDYPPHFFLQGGQSMGVAMAELFHRKRQNVPKKVLDQIYAEIEIKTRHIKALLRAAEITVNVDPVDIDDFGGDVEEVARLVRASLGVPRGPIENLTGIIESAGVLVVPCDFHTRKVDAISRWARPLPPIIFINKDLPKDRWRASLGHELGHIVMHTIPSPDIEDQAFQFGAEFLLPAHEVRTHLTELNMPKLAQLKRYWKVSMGMLLMRAKNLGMTTPSQDRYLWAQMARAGYKVREPAELDIGGEQPSLLQDLIKLHFDQLDYSGAELAEMLALNPPEFDMLYWDRADGGKGGLRIVPLNSQQRA
ncbi:MAG: uncharacterized protein JWO59_684 [Chloroflexi bacterium]|nr:uncharacterized protein [Chloroflexota bacterium]